MCTRDSVVVVKACRVVDVPFVYVAVVPLWDQEIRRSGEGEAGVRIQPGPPRGVLARCLAQPGRLSL